MPVPRPESVDDFESDQRLTGALGREGCQLQSLPDGSSGNHIMLVLLAGAMHGSECHLTADIGAKRTFQTTADPRM